MKFLLFPIALLLMACNPFEKPQIDAFYYPNKDDLSIFQVSYDVGDLEACRNWVQAQAITKKDRFLYRGDYECGVGPKKKYGMTIYDETVK